MKSPLVTILVVTWNRKRELLETIQCIYEQGYANFEIVVVDNGSTDGTMEALHRLYPAVRVIGLSKNLGISAGRNVGIAVSRGEILFCLDNDASPAHDTLMNLVEKFDAEPEIGVINSKIVNAYTKELDGGPGWVYSEKQKANQDTEFLSWSFSEGGAAIRKEVFDHVGLFWERLFFGCEGQDFSLRVWDAGYKILYEPRAVVYHRASLEARVSEAERDSLFLRNSLYIYFVRYPWWVLIWYAPLKTAAVMVRGASRGYLGEILHALADVISQLPALSRERQPIRNRTARLYLRLQRQHGPLSWDMLSWVRHKT